MTMVGYAGKPLTVHIARNSKVFEVALPANPTTGFQMKLAKYDQSFLRFKSQRYVASRTHLIGAGGQSIFKFELLNGKSYPKNTTMTFRYAQPWEPSSATFTKVTLLFE